MRHATVLIVEADRRTAAALRRQLTELQYQVGAVLCDIAQIAARNAELRPDLICIDLALVEGDEGIDLARRLCAGSSAGLILTTRRRRGHALEPGHAGLAEGYLA